MCEGVGAAEALLDWAAAADGVVLDAALVLSEELDVEVRLAVVTVEAESVFSTPAPSKTPMKSRGIKPKLPVLQHDEVLFGMSQQYVGLGPSLH